jgi:hypothetical protein
LIRIFIGKGGSGKTLSAAKEIYFNPDIHYISNIKTHDMPNNTLLKGSDLILRKLVKVKKSGEPVYSVQFNEDYWVKMKERGDMINIFVDEVQNCYDARRSMSHESKIMNDFIALMRKIVSNNDNMHGCFTMITQLDMRLDIIGIEMANEIRYHICDFDKVCLACGYSWHENNEQPGQLWRCPACNDIHIKKINHRINIFYFDSLASFMQWRKGGRESYYMQEIMEDCSFYFDKYESLDWKGLLQFGKEVPE